MDQSGLLLEYLKEQYAQARQNEARQTSATTFLTAAAGVLLGLAVKNGTLDQNMWWVGLAISFIGLANWWINRAYHFGNRFHVKVAGLTRENLEQSVNLWTVSRPSQIRTAVSNLPQFNLQGGSIGEKTYAALRIVPFCVMAFGVVLAWVARSQLIAQPCL